MQAAANEATEQVSGVYLAKPAPTSKTLEAEDVKELRAYSRQSHLFAPQASTFSAQLERAALLAFGSLNCTHCGGQNGGKRERQGRGFVPLQNRRGYNEELRRYRLKRAKTDGFSWAKTADAVAKLRLCGLDAWTWAQICEFYPALPELQLKECPKCHGRGIITRETKERRKDGVITARPTGSSRHGSAAPSYEINETELGRRGRTDRRLARVRTRCPRVAGVLDTYYALGVQTLGSLWRFTWTGSKLLSERNAGTVRDIQMVENIRDHQHRNPDVGRGRRIAAADLEAQELLDLAIQTWNEVIAEDVQRSSRDAHGRTIEAGRFCWGLLDGKRSRGRIEMQLREYWLVRFAPQVHREILGHHLEVML